MSNNEFPHKVTILKKVWSPELNHWLKTQVGRGNYQYRKPQDAYTYLRYGFTREEDALAFKLMFGYGV